MKPELYLVVHKRLSRHFPETWKITLRNSKKKLVVELTPKAAALFKPRHSVWFKFDRKTNQGICKTGNRA
jgi:hypothetical protein